MKPSTPPSSFWQSSQSFLIFAPAPNWPKIIEAVNDFFTVSKFDYDEIGQESSVSIEEARMFEALARKLPTQGNVRLCVIKNADRSSDAAANALLKILEEVPHNTRFLLLAQTRRILPTIRSRCSEWSYNLAYNRSEILLPLDKSQNFATVSLKINKIVEDGQAVMLLDQWTSQLIQENRHQPLHWLIEARNLLDSTAINAVALLEVTYLHIVNDIALPKTILKTSRTYGNI